MTSKNVLQRKLITSMVSAGITVLLSVSVAHGAFFDTAGKSARAMGMGEVFLASSSDATSYWYNPAGLANYTSRQVGIGYGKPVSSISDLMTSQVNFVTPLGQSSGLGLGVSYGGIDVATDMVISGAYGIALGDNLALGGNLKVLYWSAEGQENEWGPGQDEDLSKTSFTLDLSAIYSLGAMLGADNLTSGVYVRNAIMPNISESGDDGGKLPVEAGLGLMVEKSDIVVGADFGFMDGNSIIRCGAESPVAGSNLLVRGGYVYASDFEEELEKSDINLGLGYTFSSLQFDYAYNIPFAMKETNGKHYVSFGFSF